MSKNPNILARYSRALHNETFAGMVLMVAAVIAIVWANSPFRETYEHLAHWEVGPEALGLHLGLAHWAADALLAVFFFTVGLELKQEFAIGSLRDRKLAMVPMVAAAFGMIGPILVYTSIQLFSAQPIYDGWAVPVATDIAFALGVLGLVGKGLPQALRTFLMTLAVVDDLLAIILIAVFFSENINLLWLAASLATIAIYGFVVQKRITKWWILWPLAILAWYFMFLSGIHATIAAVALGLTVPAIQKVKNRKITMPMTEFFTQKYHAFSAGFVVPAFAFFAAGVNVVDKGGLGELLADHVSVGIYLGLPLGKMLGITLSTWVMVKFFNGHLGRGVKMPDIAAMGLISGVGFTVSLLIAQLSFPEGSSHGAHAAVSVILGSLLAIVLGGWAARVRAHHHMRLADKTNIRRSDGPSDERNRGR
ncbi:NhaA family Na+:H+ antiporter [Arcanobacterium wilhelmae]|uniref:Na(+)/H(+) antiporter NhaA n=1 Tax=Arcanobacterium wilhelmae TaxID=1803177 RepID=A0ABT9NC11_9ACTO|nr:Na+/H+ antiporter NhaA [Arcanobacterium wilhelmae]MDP9801244.1 NhaA family Na+:H+ antiporter [Arcanobacterium wilhelmae]